ncbi:MAG: hypothetical protein PHR35_03330, partial [Kiritimatiellae bacterium]|nr:hypothetical protein [Kiritimatiellia bacterium]
MRYSVWLIATLVGAGCVTALRDGGRVVLVKEGQPAATIVIADEPVRIPLARTDPATRRPVPLTVAYAAQELQLLIEKATGAKLPIVAASKAPAEGTLVLVG